MAIQKLEVGEISNKVFMLLVLDSIHSYELGIKKSEVSKELYSNMQISIAGRAENDIVLYYLESGKNFDYVFEISFTYKYNHIYVDGKYYLDFKEVFEDEQEKKIEENISKELEMLIEQNMSVLSRKIMKGLQMYEDMVNCFPYMFNDVTCLNENTRKIETVRLSPYYDVLPPNRLATYDAAINRLEEHKMVYSEEKNKCIAQSFNRNGYGNFYMLSAEAIVEQKPTGAITVWTPIPAIESSANLPLNKILVLKDAENADSKPEYLYMSTKGVFYNSEVVAATISRNEIYELLYAEEDKSLAIGMLESGKVGVRCKSGDVETVKEYNIEAVVERSEANNIESLQPFTSQLAVLSDAKIYDGTVFEPFNCHDEEESGNEASLGFNLGRLVEIVRKYWKIILGIIALLMLLFI